LRRRRAGRWTGRLRRRHRNAELANIFTREAKAFGINGEVTFDFGAAFDRSRDVAEGRVRECTS
jgi:hypothetical protein